MQTVTSVRPGENGRAGEIRTHKLAATENGPFATQQNVAHPTGIQYKYLQNIEAGRWPNLTLATLDKIAAALKVKPRELICEMPTGEKKAPV